MSSSLRQGSVPVALPTEGTLILESGRSDRQYWRDLWRYRELFLILAWRDISVQYKQTVIGVAWALIRPALTVGVFTVIFGRVAGLKSDGEVPYPLLVMCGMLPWFLMSTVLGSGSNSLVSNANLLSKVYFPRLIVPFASTTVAIVDFLLTLLMLAAMMVWFGFLPGWQLVFLPLFLALAILTGLGPALLMAALNIKYRDFRFLVPFVIQFGLYISPVGFSSSVVPDQWKLLYALNPAVSVIDGFRWCLLGGQAPLQAQTLALGTTVMLLLLWLGVSVFRGTERKFADLI